MTEPELPFERYGIKETEPGWFIIVDHHDSDKLMYRERPKDIALSMCAELNARPRDVKKKRGKK